MLLKAADWHFRVDVKATREQTVRYSKDHCNCSYCQNYYDTVENAYPKLKSFLGEFGIDMHGPCEVMPFEPTLFLACYRVQGKIMQWGYQMLAADGILIIPEDGDDQSFLLWVGEMELPWVQAIAPEEVISPANLPEFMERMQQIWHYRHDVSCFNS